MTKPATTEKLSPRLRKMRERVIRGPQEISLVRAQAVTDTFKSNPDEPRHRQEGPLLGAKPSRSTENRTSALGCPIMRSKRNARSAPRPVRVQPDIGFEVRPGIGKQVLGSVGDRP